MRAELSPSDKARQTARRKAIYLELHPETGHGKASPSKEENISSFDRDTSEKTGQSDRTVRLHAERGEKIIDAAMDLVRGTHLDTGTYLDKLKRLSPSEQVTAAKRDLAHIRQQEREKPKGGIANRVQPRPEAPTYEAMRGAILLLADLKAEDYTRLCPPTKRAAMFQKLTHLTKVFEAVTERVA